MNDLNAQKKAQISQILHIKLLLQQAFDMLNLIHTVTPNNEVVYIDRNDHNAFITL